MKSKRARLLACLLVCAIGVACSACGKSSDSGSTADNSEETLSAEELESMQKQDMTFEYALDPEETDSDTDVPVNQGVDNQSGSSSEDSYVVVTDEAGQEVLDEDGNVVTELVTANNSNSSATTTVAGDNSSSNNGDDSAVDTSSYTASMKTFQAYWLDMSSGADVVCNGDFLDVTFKIKDDAPDGNYTLSTGSNDFANWDAESVPVQFIEGDIAVGSASEKTVGTPEDGTFTITAGTAKGNQGDEVTVRFDMSDNPGIVALIFRFQYDSNALEIVNAVVGDDCSDDISMAIN